MYMPLVWWGGLLYTSFYPPKCSINVARYSSQVPEDVLLNTDIMGHLGGSVGKSACLRLRS